MKTEREKMLTGQLYNPLDGELRDLRKQARILFREFNESSERNIKLRKQLLKALIPNLGRNVWIEPPFFCDYGSNIELGDEVFFNFNCTVLDVCRVQIGDRTLIASGVQILTASHPLDYKERALGLELGKPVRIGRDVWIGAGAIICPGVTIGSRTVIGAGSVVTKNIPEGVLAAGNPCRIIRELEH